MNFYLKYAPVIYYIQTRILEKCDNIKSIIFESINQIWSCMGIGLSLLLYLLITDTFNLSSIFIYFYLYIIFIVFYEIGCIHNDYVAIKKERNPRIHTKDNPSIKWYINSVIVRFFMGVILLLVLLFFSKALFLDTIIFIGLLLIVFYLHNKIRIPFYNYITLFFLRFLKYSIVFVVITFLYNGWFPELLFMQTFVIFIIDYFSQTLNWLNVKMGGVDKIITGNIFAINVVSNIVLFCVMHDYIFLYYLIIFILGTLLITPKKYLLLKNNPTSTKK